jgi:hypothetical protein
MLFKRHLIEIFNLGTIKFWVYINFIFTRCPPCRNNSLNNNKTKFGKKLQKPKEIAKTS